MSYKHRRTILYCENEMVTCNFWAQCGFDRVIEAKEVHCRGRIGRCDQINGLFYTHYGDLRYKSEPRTVPEITLEVWEEEGEGHWVKNHLLHFKGVSLKEFKHNGECLCECSGDYTLAFEEGRWEQAGDEEIFTEGGKDYLLNATEIRNRAVSRPAVVVTEETP